MNTPDPTAQEPATPCVVCGSSCQGEYVSTRAIQFCNRCGSAAEDARFSVSARRRWLVLRAGLRIARMFRSSARQS